MVGQVVTLATAARAAGVTHLQLRSGPVRELVLLPADPPATVEPSREKDAQELAAEAEQRRNAALYGGRA